MSDYITRGQAMYNIMNVMRELHKVKGSYNKHISKIPNIDSINDFELRENAQNQIKVKIGKLLGVYRKGTYHESVRNLQPFEFVRYYGKICQLAETLKLDSSPEMEQKILITYDSDRQGVKEWFTDKINNVKNLFKDDGSEQIFTLGATASGNSFVTSKSVEVGIWYDPKNNTVHHIAVSLACIPLLNIFASGLMVINMDEAGLYASSSAGVAAGGVSVFAGASVGTFISKEHFQGMATEWGASGGPPGFSAGGDLIYNLDGEFIGGAVSFGPGIGLFFPAEAHARLGVTGIVTIFGGEENE